MRKNIKVHKVEGSMQVSGIPITLISFANVSNAQTQHIFDEAFLVTILISSS
uniref:Uncharacterized protein n=1 Tax=Rhizophora mucronata TaxID=61149 RepID=A0A2P2N1L7_RHIMU